MQHIIAQSKTMRYLLTDKSSWFHKIYVKKLTLYVTFSYVKGIYLKTFNFYNITFLKTTKITIIILSKRCSSNFI